MKKIIFVFLLVAGFFVNVSHAQIYKGLVRGARSRLNRLHHAIVKPVGVTPWQVERAVVRAGKETPAALTVQRAAKAMIPLRDRHRLGRYFNVKATAFIIEETYQGKKYIWGVTATHYRYKKPAIPVKRFSYEPTPFVAQGHLRANDVSIFRIPESLAGQFEPLKLAPHSPEVGERLFSLSFFDNHFQYTPGRKVLQKTPLRFTTSLRADMEIEREGECGSPLINQQGEVAGMVVGASYNRQIGYAVPVDQIHQILRAYHEREFASLPVRVNGKELFKLDVTEAITDITIKYKDGSMLTQNTYHKENLLDYEHLETFMDLSQATELRLTINTRPFQTENAGFNIFNREIIYNLQTQQMSTKLLP